GFGVDFRVGGGVGGLEARGVLERLVEEMEWIEVVGGRVVEGKENRDEEEGGEKGMGENVGWW
uniref:hypothetical protein n=1 Tax=Paenibacillus xylanexedens TaxID=528191 RepID=UPI001C92BD10